MESMFGGLESRIVLTEGMRDVLKHIEFLNQKVYDITVRPEPLMDYMAGILNDDLRVAGIDVDKGEMKTILSCHHSDDGIPSRLAGLRFSKRREFPWSIDTVTSMQHRLTSGNPGYEPGRIRNRPYCEGAVPDCLQDYAESDLTVILRMLNQSPYHPLISAVLFWNGLELLQPFQGDNSLVYREALTMALNSRNYRGVMRIPLAKHLADSEETLCDARRTFIESGDPNPMIKTTVGRLASAFEEAYEELGPMDVKKIVDGLSRSIIRNSRRRESFVLSDTHSWLGDISDQTFRARISYLIDLGILRKVGNTRATRYQYVDPFEDIRKANGGSLPHLDEDYLQLLYLGVGSIARP